MTLADRIAILNRGVLEQYGAPLDVYSQPKTRFVASFIGTPPMNFLPVTRFKVNAPSQSDFIGFRAERTRFQDSSENKDSLQLGNGRVNLVEPLGSMTLVHLKIGDNDIVVETRSSPPKLDQQLNVCVDPKDVFFFNREGVRLT
jgi:ABC-type sugar transport system ATPase subunit